MHEFCYSEAKKNMAAKMFTNMVHQFFLALDGMQKIH